MPRTIHIVLLALILFAAPVLGQTGRWVSHGDDITGNGYLMQDVGRSCAAVTKGTTAQLRFFSIFGAAWIEENLDFEQDWIYLNAEGHVALAVSDSFAVAFNALTSTAHVQRYEGERLRDQLYNESYDCAGKIAYLATDEFLYVFDAVIDSWQSTPLTTPANYINCRSCVGDDFIGVSLERSDSDPAWTHAYSTQVNAFAFTDHGTAYGPIDGVLDHGFAGTDLGYPELWLVGYSAFTNTFARQQIPENFSLLQERTSNWHGLEKRTVYAAVCSVSGFNDPRHHHFWGYDSIRGSWTHDVTYYDPTEWTYHYDLRLGGRYAVTTFEDIDTGELHYRIYSGFDGSTTVQSPGLFAGGHNQVTGGTTFVALKRNVMAWGYDVEHEHGATMTLGDEDVTGLRTEGTNFSIFSAWRYDEDVMDIHAYHGPTNTWASCEEWKYQVYDDDASHHVYALIRLADDVGATFYSGHRGAFSQTNFPWTSTRPWWRSNNLAYVLCPGNGGCLYDAHRDQLHFVDYEFDANTGIGDGVFVGGDVATQTAWGFSEITNTWASYDLGEAPRYGEGNDQVGWMADAYPSNNVVAFNGVHGNWVPLGTGSVADDILCGGRTILVIDWYGYHAFDPQGPIVPIEDPSLPEPTPVLPATLALHPVHPNPFNPTTRLAFDLPRPGSFTLRVHDLRGRMVRTLAEGVAPAGTHTASWNGRDDAGRELPSGTYVIRLEAEQYAATQRATLLK
jgi:hypothetical protein